MQQVRCTNCGSTAIIPDESGEFCKCEACGSTFNVPKASAFSKVELDHTQDIRAWREYLAKQLRLQQESSKARDYGGVRLFAQKILSVLPDDFCALYYAALADRCDDNDTAYTDFLHNAKFDSVTPTELNEVVNSLVATAEPKYLDDIKAFIARAYPSAHANYDAALDRSIKNYIQKLRFAKTAERDVFICHRTAAPDQDVADAVCTRLEERGLRCWIAPRNILAGSQNYERDIIKGVENCRIFLFISSLKSIYSEDCEMELKAAVLADKALYSYRIDDTEYDGAFKRALSPVQWLDAADDPYAHLEQLVIDIKGMLAEDEREKAELEEKRLVAREQERLIAEEQRAREKERLDRLEKIVSGGMAAPIQTGNYRSRLKRAEIEIESGRFERAENLLDEVLDCDPENALAWWLLLLCDYHVKGDTELAMLDVDFTVNANYKNAVRFADPTFKKRIEEADSGYRVHVIKSVDDALDEAEKFYSSEDFKALSAALDKCRSSFADEDGLIFKKFPDVASRYFWLKLWAKYGQTALVCVEDITRETEYKTAMRYASPAQAAEYERVRSTVSKNAQLFLRERSKNRANDGKLVDYLVDNKNILPTDTYNYYSSLLYYRKMLSQLNMTEERLKTTTIDITTNEYFMLAQSLATDEQKRAYDELAATLDRNRNEKSRREADERSRREEQARRRSVVIGVTKLLRILMTVASFVMIFAAIIVWTEAIEDLEIHYNDMFMSARISYHSTACIILLVSTIFRIVNDIIYIAVHDSKGFMAIPILNIIGSIVVIPCAISMFVWLGANGIVIATLMFSVISIAISSVAINRGSKIKNNNK